MSALGSVRVQEVRLVLGMLAVVGVAACSARGPQPVAPVAAAPPPRATWVAYVVQTGDTLGRIAACSGSSVGELAERNGIPDPDLLLAGERLTLPEAHRCAVTHPAATPKTSLAQPPSVIAARADGHRLLDAATARNDAADFEAALALAADCTARLAPHVPDPEADAIRARCHLQAGMAAAGLEQRDRAIEEFRQAFAIDPRLELPPQSSPRILELADATGRKSAASR